MSKYGFADREHMNVNLLDRRIELVDSNGIHAIEAQNGLGYICLPPTTKTGFALFEGLITLCGNTPAILDLESSTIIHRRGAAFADHHRVGHDCRPGISADARGHSDANHPNAGKYP